MHNFTNVNSIPWYKWLLLKSDNLPAVAFFFLSQKNFTGGRYYPLFDQMSCLRIVIIKGSRFRKFDYIQIKFVHIFARLTHKKQARYGWVLIFTSKNKMINPRVNQILNIDDPSYSPGELVNILNWEKKLSDHGSKTVIITTNEFTKEYFSRSQTASPVYIVEQGHKSIGSRSRVKNDKFSCVYSSPYIDIYSDKHSRHETWGVELFITSIIPKILRKDSEIDIHIIGRLGKETKNFLEMYPRVITHNLKSIEDNFDLISRCHIGLYPRNIDNKRRVLKIYDYIGAGLPIVAFNLEDTKPVNDFKLGLSVDTIEEFVNGVIRMKNDKDLYSSFIENINKLGDTYSWNNLASRYDQLVRSNFEVDFR
jgi:hypothetical protein